MTGPIVIRNLTPQPLTLKLVERYEAPEGESVGPSEMPGTFSVSNLTQGLNNLVGNVTHKASPTNSRRGSKSSRRSSLAEVVEKSNKYRDEEVDIRIEPFTTCKTDIKTSERGPRDILRLTLHGDGGARWRIDTPTPSTASQELQPLDPNPQHDYAAIYNSSNSLLALFESSNPRKWMRPFADSTPLSALSIPGTHNSPCYYTALPSVRCQAVAPREQLQNGVRFFDLRLQPTEPDDPKSDDLQLVHGVFPISLTGAKKFRPLVNDTLDFLKHNPSETIIMSLKREGAGSATDAQLSLILKYSYTDSQRWWTEPRIPTLGEARGKIVLLRRFALSDRIKSEFAGRGWGLDGHEWAYNTADHAHGHVQVQDFCEVLETENIDKKIKLCCDHFERAGSAVAPVKGVTTDAKNPVPAGPLFLNFLSASNFWKVGCWPDKIAAKLNPAVTTFLCERHDVGDCGLDGPGKAFEGDGGVGVVVCDWVGAHGDWDLVRCVVGMNGRLLLKQGGEEGWRRGSR